MLPEWNQFAFLCKDPPNRVHDRPDHVNAYSVVKCPCNDVTIT